MPSPLQAVADELEAGTFNPGPPPAANASPAEREAAHARSVATATAVAEAYIRTAKAAGRTPAEIKAGLAAFLNAMADAVDTVTASLGTNGASRRRKRRLTRRR